MTLRSRRPRGLPLAPGGLDSPARRPPPTGRTSSSSMPTTWATATSGVTGRRGSARRTSTGWRGRACGSPTPTPVVDLHAVPLRPADGRIRLATEGDGRPPRRRRPHHRAGALDPARDAEAGGLRDGGRRQVASRARDRPDRLERRDPAGSAGGRIRRRLHHGGDRRPGAVRVHPGAPGRRPRSAATRSGSATASRSATSRPARRTPICSR